MEQGADAISSEFREMVLEQVRAGRPVAEDIYPIVEALGAESHGLKASCRLLGVSSAGFFHWSIFDWIEAFYKRTWAPLIARHHLTGRVRATPPTTTTRRLTPMSRVQQTGHRSPQGGSFVAEFESVAVAAPRGALSASARVSLSETLIGTGGAVEENS